MAKKESQPLNSKEQSLFRSVVKHYEAKQYKKGLKAAEQILRAAPNHGETQAMKALILNSLGQQDEAFALAKIALTNDMKSHVCWHVYGLLYRSVRNYEEAIKAYKFALRIEPDQQNILRDLSLLQVQMRDYDGYIESRVKILKSRATVRQNWTALAVAYHLAGLYKESEKILTNYEETLKQNPPRTDIEHSEALLYKNTIIAESGDVQRALEHLEANIKDFVDRTAALELKAQYLAQLGKKEDAAKAYRVLLERNNEYRAYYEGLEEALELDRSDEEALPKLQELYESYASKNERVDAPRRIPLDFLKGDAFKAAADNYLRRMLNKGVPSTFPNIKALYADPEKKKIIEELVLSYASEKQANGSAHGEVNGSVSDRFEQSVLYFLAQHYTYRVSRDLEKATQYIDQLIEKNPKSVDYNQTKARIFKHYGNTRKAAETINHARQLDEKDRYINTKCAKYQLRNNQNEFALTTMSKFTRNEAAGGPLGDLLDMQCMWFLTEDGEAYQRRRNLGLALKRFTSIADIFDIWYEDQFDFHGFSLRKGQIRAYIDMVRWEDHLRDHPFFTRAAVSAVRIYVDLADNPNLRTPNANAIPENADANERKKAQKKAKKEQEKREKEAAEKKAAAAAAAKKQKDKGDDGESKKVDTDPEGLQLLETKEPLEAALRFLTPLLEFSPKNLEAQELGFEVYWRRKKYLLALKSLLATRSIDENAPKLHEQAVAFRLGLPKDLPPQVSEVIQSTFFIPADTDLKAYNSEWQQKHQDSPAHLQSAYQVRYLLDPSTKGQNEADVKELLNHSSATRKQAQAGLALLGKWKSDDAVIEAYREAAASKWPEATVFEKL